MSPQAKKPWILLTLVVWLCLSPDFAVRPAKCMAQAEVWGAALIRETDAVIQGRITRRGEFYDIEIASQSRISIPVARVAHVAASVEDLYQYKLSMTTQWNAGDHFQLTRWCLRNGLLEQASAHFTAVASQQGDHPRVKQLAIELQTRLLQEPGFRQYLGLAHPDSDTVQSASHATEGTYAATASPAIGSAVITASSHTSAAIQHPEIANRFSERIQPILMNRCSQAACHGVRSSNDLRLIEPYARNHARITSENLASVWKQISTDREQLSPLLAFATQAHGLQRTPAIALTETHLLNELQEWIRFALDPVVPAGGSGQTPAASLPQSNQPEFVPFLNPAVTLLPVPQGMEPLRPVPHQQGTIEIGAAADPLPELAFPTGEQPPSASEIDALDANIRRLLGEPSAASGVSVETDPFDPAEFNRKLGR